MVLDEEWNRYQTLSTHVFNLDQTAQKRPLEGGTT